jgi:hypothetical protein
MTLKTIAENSNYVTDEEITSANLLGIANNAIAEVNAYCGCSLPLFEDTSLTDSDAYEALNDSWQIRLLEPYYSYSIMANDGDSDARDFHYNRFLKALEQFKTAGSGSGGLGDLDEDYAGDSVKSVEIDVSSRTMNWMGWF